MSNLGYGFEVDIVDELRKEFSAALRRTANKIYRVIGSGRNKLATKSGGDTVLEGDVSVELDFLPKPLLVECKHHKSKAGKGKSHPLLKEWCDQALDEAIKNNRLSVLAIKFKSIATNSLDYKKYIWADGHFGNSIHYIIPQKHFHELLKYIEELYSQKTGNGRQLSEYSNDELLAEIKRRFEK